MINHETLALWEIPLLEKAGFSYIFTPQSIPNNPVFTSGSVIQSKSKNFLLSEDDAKHLAKQNWYGEIDSKASRIANENFEMAFTTADPNQVITLLNAFDGLIIVRLFGLDGDRTYSELYRSHFTPYELQLFKNNLHRIVFALGYRELLEPEDPWIRERCVFLPIGLPERPDLNWEGSSDKVLAVVPRIEPGSYYETNLANHEKMSPRSNLIIGGRQHLKFSDERILGSLQRTEFNDFLRTSRCMVYASKEARHVHYHPLEAMQIGLPVVYLKGTLLSRIVGEDNDGAVKNYKRAKRIVRKMIRNKKFATKVGEKQKKLVRQIERDNLESSFIEGCHRLLKIRLQITKNNKDKIIFCESGKDCENCEVFKNVKSKTLKFKKIEELYEELFKTKAKGDFQINGINSALNRVSGGSQFSRIFNADKTFLDLLWLDSEKFEIILCDRTHPEVILTYCKVARKLRDKTCDAFLRGNRDKTLEQLRVTLQSLDILHVSSVTQKEVIEAFVPIDSSRIQEQTKEL